VTRSVESFKLVVAKFVIYPSLMKDGMLNTPGRVTAVKSHKIHSFGIQTAGLYPISFISPSLHRRGKEEEVTPKSFYLSELRSEVDAV